MQTPMPMPCRLTDTGVSVARASACTVRLERGTTVSPRVIRIRALNKDVLLTADVFADQIAGEKTAGTPLPAVATELPAAFHVLLVDGHLQGTVLLRRFDVAGAETETVTVTTDAREETTSSEDAWFVSELSAGHAQRFRLSAGDYERLIKLGHCTERNVQADTECLARLQSTLPKDSRSVSLDMSIKDRVTDYIYEQVSAWLGRDVATEFASRRLASVSEPIVLFIGLSGVNRSVLLDCQDLEKVDAAGGSVRRCSDYARVSARTLERARHLWVAYLEDEDVPFATTIDVEVSGRGNAAEYEEFDPRVSRRAPLDGTDANAQRAVKIGLRRFRLPDRPVAVQVAFSRQGAGYGLRQWVWTYQKYSRSPVAVAVGALLTPVPVVTLRDEPDNDDDDTRRFVFGTVSMRFPQWRGKGYDQSRGRSLLYFLTPGVTFGMADLRTFMVGGSILVPVANDRVSIAGGFALTRDPEAGKTTARTCSFSNLCPMAGITIDFATFR